MTTRLGSISVLGACSVPPDQGILRGQGRLHATAPADALHLGELEQRPPRIGGDARAVAVVHAVLEEPVGEGLEVAVGDGVARGQTALLAEAGQELPALLAVDAAADLFVDPALAVAGVG